MAVEVWPATTSATLLVKLSHPERVEEWNEAWKRFVRLYRPGILTWCRRMHLQEADAEEVMSRVLEKLHRKMAFFECRRWLWLVLSHAFQSLPPEAAPPARPNRQKIADLMRSITTEETDKISHMKSLMEGPQEGQGEPASSAFRQVYRPVILRCADHWGLEPKQAEDFADLLLPKIAAAMHNPGTKPRFRSWLYKVVQNAARDCINEIHQLPRGILIDAEASADFEREIMLADLREQAEENVRARVQPLHFEVYRLMVHEERSGDEVATETGLSISNVYQIASRVKKQIQAQILNLPKRPGKRRDQT
jgi:DNA-directed RNA polymerase specialized sigma24 family protein